MSVKKLFYVLYFRTVFYKYLINKNLKRAIELQWNLDNDKPINWDNPQTLNEKIQWLQLYTDTSIWSKYADKYELRSLVKELGYEDCLPKLYGIWDSVEDIDFDSLPKRFVLKCTHDSHSTMIIDKESVNYSSLKKKFKKYVKTPFGYANCEPHYTKIKPRIIAEELLPNTCSDISFSLIDYKVWCFNGKPSFVWTAYNRKHDSVCVDLYDLNWNLCSNYNKFTNLYRDGHGIVPRPKSLEKMLEIASVMSKGFPQVRIDFYDIAGKPYIGEMTFTSACGRMPFFSDEAQLRMGQMIDLPLLKK